MERNFCLNLLNHLLTVGKKGIDPDFQLLKLERLGDVGICSCGISLGLVLFLVLGGEQDDRQLPETLVRLQLLGQFDTIHDWHHHVAHHEVEFLLHDDVFRLLSVLCRKHMIVLAQYLQHQGEQFLVVLHHQDLARILSDEDALADRCQLRFVFRSRLEFQLRFLACLSDGFPIYCICFFRIVYFIWCIRTFSDRQGDGEGSAFAFRTFTLDIAMMQFHQVVGQRQSDAGSRHVLLAVVAIEESGVEMLHLLFRHTDAIIRDGDDSLFLAEAE